MTNYKLVFTNQSIDSAKTYELIKETKHFVFLDEIGKYPSTFILRVEKKTLSVKAFHRKGEYAFDMPKAIELINEATTVEITSK